MTDMPEVAMDVKGLCERLVSEASDGWTGDAVCVDAALAAEAAAALSTLSRELAEARAERMVRGRRGTTQRLACALSEPAPSPPKPPSHPKTRGSGSWGPG